MANVDGKWSCGARHQFTTKQRMDLLDGFFLYDGSSARAFLSRLSETSKRVGSPSRIVMITNKVKEKGVFVNMWMKKDGKRAPVLMLLHTRKVHPASC